MLDTGKTRLAPPPSPLRLLLSTTINPHFFFTHHSGQHCAVCAAQSSILFIRRNHHTEARLCALLIHKRSRIGCGIYLHTPNHAHAGANFSRIIAECSLMPAVNTKASHPPPAAKANNSRRHAVHKINPPRTLRSRQCQIPITRAYRWTHLTRRASLILYSKSGNSDSFNSSKQIQHHCRIQTAASVKPRHAVQCGKAPSLVATHFPPAARTNSRHCPCVTHNHFFRRYPVPAAATLKQCTHKTRP